MIVMGVIHTLGTDGGDDDNHHDNSLLVHQTSFKGTTQHSARMYWQRSCHIIHGAQRVSCGTAGDGDGDGADADGGSQRWCSLLS